jgi:hypothetical protein
MEKRILFVHGWKEFHSKNFNYLSGRDLEYVPEDMTNSYTGGGEVDGGWPEIVLIFEWLELREEIPEEICWQTHLGG